MADWVCCAYWSSAGCSRDCASRSAGRPNWDVVQVESEELALGCADGIFEKLDWAKLGGKEAYLPAAVDDCGIGAIVWSTGIAYIG